jgi:hypothetical protein
MTTLKDLKALAKELGIKGTSSAKKEALAQMIESHHMISTIQAQALARMREKEQKKTKAEAEVQVTDAPTDIMMDESVKEPKPKDRKSSSWNTFLKSYRQENGCSLKEAMKAKDAYVEWKAKQSESPK